MSAWTAKMISGCSAYWDDVRHYGPCRGRNYWPLKNAAQCGFGCVGVNGFGYRRNSMQFDCSKKEGIIFLNLKNFKHEYYKCVKSPLVLTYSLMYCLTICYDYIPLQCVHVYSVHTLPKMPTGPKVPQLLKVTGPLNGCWT